MTPKYRPDIDGLREKGHFSVETVTPQKYICADEYCYVAVNGNLLYRDDDHLSTFGSEYISISFEKVFRDYSMSTAEYNPIHTP